jgi:hypothetical protein
VCCLAGYQFWSSHGKILEKEFYVLRYLKKLTDSGTSL